MYRVICKTDNQEYVLHDLRDRKQNGEDTSGRMILRDAVVHQEDNAVASFNFKIDRIHPNIGKIKSWISDIIVYDDEFELFRGFPLIDQQDFYLTGTVQCESILSFFNDSVIRPYDYSGPIRGYLEMLVESHNQQVDSRKQFQVGNVTVTDPNDYIIRSNTEAAKTLEEIRNKLPSSSLGGYLKVRHVQGINYIDYLETYGSKNNQKIEYARNLIDLSRKRDYSGIATAIIPYGAEMEVQTSGEDAENESTEKKRVDITSVNNGLDYIVNEEAAAVYGYIFTYEYFDDVTLPENLKKKAEDRLNQLVYFEDSITVNAVDLNLTGEESDKIRYGDIYDLHSKPHNLTVELMLSSCDIYINDWSRNVFTFGSKRQGSVGGALHRLEVKTEDAIQKANQRFAEDQKRLNEVVRSASGLYYSEVEKDDGTTIYYYHDKKKIDDSMVLITINDAGIMVSNDGGDNWYGLQVNGDLLARILSAYGIKAEWIKAGIIQSFDGDTYFDLDNNIFALGTSLVYKDGKLTFGDDVTIGWDGAEIPTKVSQLDNDAGYQDATQVTQITKDTVTTSYVNSLEVTAKSVAADAIKSSNYNYSSGDFSAAGTFLDLSNGALTSKNFSILSDGSVKSKGYFEVTGGKIGGFTINDNSFINNNNSLYLSSSYGRIVSVGSSYVTNGTTVYPYTFIQNGTVMSQYSTTNSASDVSNYEYSNRTNISPDGLNISSYYENTSGKTARVSIQGKTSTFYKDGNVWLTIDNTLRQLKIESEGSLICDESSQVYLSRNVYVGGTGNAEKNVHFSNLNSGTYPHNCKLYGGNSGSSTAIGLYDSLNDRAIWRYNDVDNKIDSDSQLDYGAISIGRNTTNTTAVTTDIRYYPFLRIVVFSARFTTAAFNAGDSRQLATMSSTYAPKITTALRMWCNTLAVARNMSAYVGTDGEIRISTGTALDAGKYIYLSGVWNY